MRRINRLTIALTVVLLAALACNLPQATPTTDPGIAFTAAAQTVAAQLTQSAPTLSAPTATGLPPSPTNTGAPTVPPPPTTAASATTECDRAQFVKDVSIDDGTVMSPNEAFTKTWRLRNIGSCTWAGYSLVFDTGNSMNGPASSAIANTPPGGTVDISVNLVAPAAPGNYRGYWRIRNVSGYLLPVSGGYQGKSFYVDIKVAVTSSGFDLHSRAAEAEWIGGDSGGGVVLTFGGPDTDLNGFAMYRNGSLLEDGSTPAKILEMHPKWVDDGVISGRYPAYTIVAGERFRAKIGFLAKADGTCGVGNVKFQLNYMEAGTIHPLGAWAKTCNGSLTSLDVDLSGLAGHAVQLILAVLANGPSSQDWAVWVAPRVVLP